MDKDFKEKLNKYEKGTAEYYRELCFCTDIWLKYDTQRVFEEKYTQATKTKDYPMLKSVFYHECKLQLLPLWDSGYDHSYKFNFFLDLLACDNFDSVYRLFPEGIIPAANGYSMHVKATNLVLCMLYNKDGNVVYDEDKVVEQAEKYITTKQPANDRMLLACLLAIYKHDVAGFSEYLQKVCEGYSRNDIFKWKKLQCKCAYGLIALAKHIWNEEEFGQIKYPEYKNFDKGYIDWLLGLDKLPNDLCFEYKDDFEEMNIIMKMPVAKSYIYQPYLGSDNPYISARAKKDWYLDKETMLGEFCKEIINEEA